ncbi:peptidoglycan-binding protein [Aerosakkonemataceae cyanobacterium BLCC-F154]|uniref:Peptidoglycan-binding protein n=1 Tax=Floridaenema fluviatile BLCC-F154 TaxID=3153640 RepID=A0ABV4Y4X5_9CYAN
MATKLLIVGNTILKQEPIESSLLPPEKKFGINVGKEIELQRWTTTNNSHIKIELAAPINGKETWFAFSDHVQIRENGIDVRLDESRTTSVMLKNYQSCSTAGLKGLDQQIIAEMNEITPNSLVRFDDLNVKLGAAAWPLLQLPAKRALARAIADRGRQMFVNSGYRTIAQQQVLFNHYQAGRCGIPIAARPPRSNHQSGLAIDVEDWRGWKPFLERHGWKQLAGDPVHFDFLGGGTRDIRRLSVLAFQRLWNKHNLNDRIDEDGFFGPQTERRLKNSFVEGFDISNPEGFRVLRLTEPLMQGDDVRQVQQALIKLGYSVGESGADGFYGMETVNAVRKFQQDKGLEVDGIVGPATRQKLGL